MRPVFVLTYAVLFAGGALFGGPVATISSSGTFELRGVEVKVDGVPSWPMLAGDDVRTTNAPALIQFRDGTRVTLAEKSQAKVEKSGEGLVLRLRTGSMEFNIASGSTLKVFNADMPVAAAAGVTRTTTTGSRLAVTVTSTVVSRRPPPPAVSP
jgi:hypothetical protein